MRSLLTGDSILLAGRSTPLTTAALSGGFCIVGSSQLPSTTMLYP
jgi:hypothetical protein